MKNTAFVLCLAFVTALLYLKTLSEAVVQANEPSKSLLRFLEAHILAEKLEGKVIYVSSRPLAANTVIPSWQDAYSVPDRFDKAWFMFVDDLPNANWEHPCRYIFIDVNTQEYTIEQARTPPTEMDDMVRLYP